MAAAAAAHEEGAKQAAEEAGARLAETLVRAEMAEELVEERKRDGASRAAEEASRAAKLIAEAEGERARTSEQRVCATILQRELRRCEGSAAGYL